MVDLIFFNGTIKPTLRLINHITPVRYDTTGMSSFAILIRNFELLFLNIMKRVSATEWRPPKFLSSLKFSLPWNYICVKNFHVTIESQSASMSTLNTKCVPSVLWTSSSQSYPLLKSRVTKPGKYMTRSFITSCALQEICSFPHCVCSTTSCLYMNNWIQWDITTSLIGFLVVWVFSRYEEVLWKFIVTLYSPQSEC